MLVACALAPPTASAIDPPPEAALWAGVKTGRYVALIRHALAPGSGDPGTFKLGDCGTQRNLSEAGRRQSRRIGARIRSFGIAKAAVYSSQWCRCRETARLLGVGPVRDLPTLDSFFRDMSGSGRQTRALRSWLKNEKPDGPVLLVTHYVNIQALTGYAPASGEVVIVQIASGARPKVAGTVRTMQ